MAPLRIKVILDQDIIIITKTMYVASMTFWLFADYADSDDSADQHWFSLINTQHWSTFNTDQRWLTLIDILEVPAFQKYSTCWIP